jgi:predicted Zn-dependent protease
MIEVLKQALDALETEVSIDWTNNDEFNASAEKMHDAITSLQQAIAELESQEPVATVTSETGADITMSWWHEPALPVGTKLFTHPPQRTWQGLTTDEIAVLHANYPNPQGFALALQAKLKEKNNA